MLKTFTFSAVIVFCLFAASCNEYQKVLKSNDLGRKMEVAEKYYNKKDYYRALPLLEELVAVHRTSREGERIYFYYAYSHYGQGDYYLAYYHFQTLARMYPNGSYTEEAVYMTAYCLYLDSPNSSLDQQNTIKALEELQLFVNRYPQSKRVSDCNKLMDVLRKKLETKSFSNARLYYQMGEYKSAVVALTNVLKDHPATVYREECLFLILKSNYLYALNSIDEKKEERYKAAIEAYHKFLDTFPQSKFLTEAQDMFDRSLKGIENLKTKNKVTP